MKKTLLISLIFLSLVSFGQTLHYSLYNYNVLSTAIDPNNSNQLIVTENVVTKIDGAVDGKFLQYDNGIIFYINANLSAKNIADSLTTLSQAWVDQHYNNH